MTISRYYTIIDETGYGSVTYIEDGITRRLDSDDPKFAPVVAKLAAGEDPSDLLHPEVRILGYFNEAVVVDGVVTYKGEPLHGAVAAKILRYARDGVDASRIVKFLDLLALNPSRRSREQLFDWAERANLVIDEDGYVVGYKGVQNDGTSVHAGGAYVNGEWVDGHVPNEVGSVITMERSNVQDDHTVDCSHGLHVGTYEYASSFGARLLTVRFSPADVVSVPNYDTSKLRCCGYEVLAISPERVDHLYDPDSFEDDDEDEVEEALGALEQRLSPKFFRKLLDKLGR